MTFRLELEMLDVLTDVTTPEVSDNDAEEVQPPALLSEDIPAIERSVLTRLFRAEVKTCTTKLKTKFYRNLKYEI